MNPTTPYRPSRVPFVWLPAALALALGLASASLPAMAKPKPKAKPTAPANKPGDTTDKPAAGGEAKGDQKPDGKPDSKPDAKPARPDPVEALLGVAGQAALVSLLHSHFAMVGLGHAVRAGAMNGQDVAIQAGTLQQNLTGLSQQFSQLATHPAFDPQLADLWRSLGQTAALGAQAAMALSDFCGHKDGPPYAVAFEDRLEAFRSRLHGLVASLQAGGK